MSDLAISSNTIEIAAESLAESLKVAPHSIEAEQSVLGGLMLDNDAWDKIADIINEHDFYRRDHRLIFRSIDALVERNSPFDVVTLSEWLDANNQLDTAGGLAYLGTLANNTPSAANILAYANIVRERSVLRHLIQVGNSPARSVRCRRYAGRACARRARRRSRT